jgi:agmatinase
MIKPPEIRYLSAQDGSIATPWQLIGLPYDGASSYRRGAKDGPAQIRKASDSIETFSPYCNRDLLDLTFADLGDLEFTGDAPETVLQQIQIFYNDKARREARLFGLGGDHAVTIGALQGLVDAGVKPHVLYLDAHLDLREEYDGTRFSHACVARRISEIVGRERLVQWGMRSGERAEFDWARHHLTYQGRDTLSLDKTFRRLKGEPVYLTLDLDLFDPAEVPGVGNPEPGGLRFGAFLALLPQLQNLDIIGADVVELAPNLDPSGRSSVMAGEIIRELLLTLVKQMH